MRLEIITITDLTNFLYVIKTNQIVNIHTYLSNLPGGMCEKTRTFSLASLADIRASSRFLFLKHFLNRSLPPHIAPSPNSQTTKS